MKNLKNKNLKEKVKTTPKNVKGITLIALVITIIVLLILAGISIATLTGDNGILTKAQNAGEETKKATAQEQVQVAIVASYDNNGDFKAEDFISEIEVQGGEIISEEDPIVVQVDDYVAEVDRQEGEILNIVKTSEYVLVKIEKGEYVEGTGVEATIKVEGELESIDKITVINLELGEEVSVTENETGGKFTAPTNGNYKVDVEATKNSKKVNGKATANVTEVQVIKDSPLSTAKGKIDIIWVDKNNKVIDKPLVEIPSDMKKVYWDDEGNEIIDGRNGSVSDDNWYKYNPGTGDNTTSKWANAIYTKDEDDSYFVWVPRYAYRVVYYDEANPDQVLGYYDGIGYRKSTGEIEHQAKAGIETVTNNGIKYIVHPAFTSNANLGGGFGNIAGIWVAKYEMSMTDNNNQHVQTDNATTGNVELGENVRMVSKPGVSSWRYINVANSFYNCLNWITERESHLMKNSEWGAVAYLTESKYGRNGNEIAVNEDSGYFTAGETGATAMTTSHKDQSSTGNETGIFDLSGGAYERTAAYIKEYSGKYFTESSYTTADGKHFVSTGGTSTEYATSSYVTWDMHIPGDASFEVYVSDHEGWHEDYSHFPYSSSPIFVRGDCYSEGGVPGVFYLSNTGGRTWSDSSFRAVVLGGP